MPVRLYSMLGTTNGIHLLSLRLAVQENTSIGSMNHMDHKYNI